MFRFLDFCLNKSYRFKIFFSPSICNVLNKNQLLYLPYFPVISMCVQLTIYLKARPISCLLRYLNSVDLLNILLMTLIFSFKYSAEFCFWINISK